MGKREWIHIKPEVCEWGHGDNYSAVEMGDVRW
jgi:hypothetical protein